MYATTTTLQFGLQYCVTFKSGFPQLTLISWTKLDLCWELSTTSWLSAELESHYLGSLPLQGFSTQGRMRASTWPRSALPLCH